MNTTLQAAVHLGQDFLENLRFTKYDLLRSVGRLFQVTGELIKNQTEISGLTTIDYEDFTWSATSLLCDKAFRITNAKTYVFADSVLGKHERRTGRNLEGQDSMVLGESLFERSESHRWRAHGVRVENIPRVHNVEPPRGNSKIHD